jgi:hypothetical protein
LDRRECEGSAGRTAYVTYLRATGAARTGYGFRPVGEDGGAGFGFGSGFGGAGCPGAGGCVEDPVYFVVLSRLSARPKGGEGEREGGNGRVTRVAEVPERVRGSQIYVEVARLEDSQRSPMYLSHHFSSALKRN